MTSTPVCRARLPRPGTELVADELVARGEPFAWELEGTCGFTSDFAYASAE